MSDPIQYSDFTKVDMRVGRIIAVDDFPEARKPAFKLTLDFGPLGVKRSSAQVTNYKKEELLNRLIVAVVNFPPKQVGKFKSEVLVLGAINPDDSVILLKPDDGAELGSPIA
jgi:tRNA-binding protein